jgi:superfamily II DNA/RNA helicase
VFNQFNFDPKINKVLTDVGYKEPTPIQEQAIPKVLEGLDVIASAQTGTGKTAAFMLPLMHFLTSNEYRSDRGPQALILVPTRELAMQVAEEAKKFSKYLNKTKTVCIYGGMPYPQQRRALSGPYEILVATPGRLIDHLQQGKVDLSRIKFLVLDEADRMLDMGFIDDVDTIVKHTPDTRQTVLFSATIDNKILPVSKKLQKNPFMIKVDPIQRRTGHIEQKLYYVDGLTHKKQILEKLLEGPEIGPSIVFTSTIHQANDLAKHLYDKGYKTDALHGDLKQNQRSRILNKLKTGNIQLLVATDVAARGIDISTLTHVFNFDLPFVAEDFIHRIGRTGRAGASGTAITFSTYQEDFRIKKINQLLEKPIVAHILEGLEPKPKGQFREKPSRRSQFGNRGRKPFSKRK